MLLFASLIVIVHPELEVALWAIFHEMGNFLKIYQLLSFLCRKNRVSLLQKILTTIWTILKFERENDFLKPCTPISCVKWGWIYIFAYCASNKASLVVFLLLTCVNCPFLEERSIFISLPSMSSSMFPWYLNNPCILIYPL